MGRRQHNTESIRMQILECAGGVRIDDITVGLIDSPEVTRDIGIGRSRSAEGRVIKISKPMHSGGLQGVHDLPQLRGVTPELILKKALKI